MTTAVEQAVTGASITEWPRVRSPVGTSFVGEVFWGFFLTCKTYQEVLAPNDSPNII